MTLDNFMDIKVEPLTVTQTKYWYWLTDYLDPKDHKHLEICIKCQNVARTTAITVAKLEPLPTQEQFRLMLYFADQFTAINDHSRKH